ncbi:hypothetical protein [Denitratisoma sp. DHT3]|nr:hypothetical protein [Denitratisoma sp. DHT3]
MALCPAAAGTETLTQLAWLDQLELEVAAKARQEEEIQERKLG